MLSVSNEPMPMREDIVTSKLDNKQILSNAPEKSWIFCCSKGC